MPWRCSYSVDRHRKPTYSLRYHPIAFPVSADQSNLVGLDRRPAEEAFCAPWRHRFQEGNHSLGPCPLGHCSNFLCLRAHPIANYTYPNSAYTRYLRSRSRARTCDRSGHPDRHPPGPLAESGGYGGAHSHCPGSSSCLADANGYSHRDAHTGINDPTRSYSGQRKGNSHAMQERPADSTPKRLFRLQTRPSRKAGDGWGRRLQVRDDCRYLA